jgi:ligand-binding sensor domain-containing protein
MKIQIIILYFVFISSNALSEEFQYINYSTNQGLPASETYQIIQDKNNLIWIATDNGIVTFDGYSFSPIDLGQNTEHCFINIFNDKNNNIWAYGLSGNIYKIDNFRKKIIQKISIDPTDGGLSRPIMVNDTTIVLNIGSKQYHINLVNSKQKKILNKNENVIHFYLNQNKVTHILKNNFEYKTIIVLLHSYSSVKKKVISHSMNIGRDRIYSLKQYIIIEGVNETLLIDTIGNVCKLNLKNITTIYESSKNEIWVGTKGNGVFRFQDINHLKNNIRKNYFKQISISSILEDNHGGYWFTSLENGIYYCPNINISNIYPSDNNAFFNCTTLLDSNHILVGQSDKKILLYNLNNNKLNYYTQYPYKDKLYDIYFDSKTQTLFAGFVFSRFNNNKWSEIYKDNLFAKRINPIKNHLALSFFSGFYTYSPVNKSFYTPIPEFRLRTNWVELIDESLYIGTTKGLYNSDGKKIKLAEIYPTPILDEVKTIKKLNNSTMVVGSSSGLYIIENLRIKYKIGEKQGLSSNAIYCIHIESDSQIWIGTKNGLDVIYLSSKKAEIFNFNVSKGLADNEIIDIYKSDRKLFVITKKGISIIGLENKFPVHHSSPPKILNIKVNEKINHNKELHYYENNIELNVLSLIYPLNGKINYRYKINQGKWQYTTDNSIRLLSLIPSTYNIQIQSQNEDKIWSESTILKFTVNPKYTDTWWFYALIAIASIFILGALFKRYFDRQKEKLKTKQRISDFEKSTLQAQMNPHFIFNSLASIQNFILKNDRDSALKYLSKFSALVRKILNQSRENEISLENEIELIDNYLQIEKLRFEDKFDFKITHNLSNSDLNCKINNLLIQPIVENAVIHGVSKKQGNGLIDIDFKKSENSLTVVVKDNGHGYFPSKVDESNPNKSVGMSITEKRLRLINKMKDNILIENLMDSNNVIIGTQVKINISIKE